MTYVNNEDRFSTAIKILEYYLKKEDYLQWKMEFNASIKFHGSHYALKRGGNPEMPKADSTDLSSDD